MLLESFTVFCVCLTEDLELISFVLTILRELLLLSMGRQQSLAASCILLLSAGLCFGSVSFYPKSTVMHGQAGYVGSSTIHQPLTHNTKENEVLRLRELIHEAREQNAHLNEDLLDAQAAQQRANHALKMKDGQLLSATESLKTLRAELESQKKRENSLYATILEQKGEIERLQSALASLEDQFRGEAHAYAAEIFEEMRSDWDANKVIELANEKALREQCVADLQAQARAPSLSSCLIFT